MRWLSFTLVVCATALVAPVMAQDADGDGVIDERDLCPSTPPGAPVDPAGCANECDAQVIGEDAFARTLLTQIGVNVTGSFGTVGPAPAGYFPRSDSSGGQELGFVADPGRTDWSIGEYHGDFFLPGAPEEGWGITWVDGDGRTGNLNNNTDGPLLADVVGAVVSADCVPSGLGAGGRGGARVVWRGTWRNGTPPHSLEVEQEAVILNEGLFILLNIALTNTSAAALEIYYLRNVDPDNNETIGCGFATTNTIVAQRPPIGASDRALVSAEQAASLGPNCESYLALAAREPVPAVVTHGGFANRSARAVYEGTGFTQAVGETLTRDDAISLATRHMLAAGESVRFSYLYVLSEGGVDDALRSVSEDTDSDGIPDAIDIDDDNDGIPDVLEVSGFAGDPSGDADGDGIPDWRDADQVPGGCPDVEPPFGVCDSLPPSIDADGDGIPNHLDLDSDGDGLTDARESGGSDANGDGRPDECADVDADGGCITSGGVSLLVGVLPDTDGAGGPDVLDLDSDGDGIDDTVEAYDIDGDGVLGGPERVPTGEDHDRDGIDDAYDPDCNPTLCAEAGAPVTEPLAPWRDANGDGVGNWLVVCGDGYVTEGEVCDTGGASATCTDTCLLTADQPCMASSECASGSCEEPAMTCAGCGTPTTPPCPELDAGVVGPDGGSPMADAGPGRDAGPALDAGAPVRDAGVPVSDAGAMDAGISGGRPLGAGLSCSAGRGRGPGLGWLVLALVFVRRRRRG